MITESKIRSIQKRIKEALSEIEKEENVKIVEKVVTKTQVVKEKAQEVVKYVDREVVKYDNSCVIPKEFVKAVNDAAEPPK